MRHSVPPGPPGIARAYLPPGVVVFLVVCVEMYVSRLVYVHISGCKAGFFRVSGQAFRAGLVYRPLSLHGLRILQFLLRFLLPAIWV